MKINNQIRNKLNEKKARQFIKELEKLSIKQLQEFIEIINKVIEKKQHPQN